MTDEFLADLNDINHLFILLIFPSGKKIDELDKIRLQPSNGQIVEIQ